MAKRKSFADDGWAIWITGDDTSTFYINEWIDPKGKNYVDVAIRIRGIKDTHDLNLFIPFEVEEGEIEDLTHHLRDGNVFRAIFSTRCIMDYMKNEYTSEVAYHGKTVDLIHVSLVDYAIKPMANGTLVTMSIDALQDYLDNDEAYIMIRMPHRNLDEVFSRRADMRSIFTRLRDLIASPVISERYACSVRVNEARLLPDEINQIGAFHRQKLNKAVVTISLHEDYQVNDANCYRIHRLEKVLYGNYAPSGFECEDAITYEWNESRERNLYGHFNFYFSVARESISKLSMLLYVSALLLVNLLSNAVSILVGI